MSNSLSLETAKATVVGDVAHAAKPQRPSPASKPDPVMSTGEPPLDQSGSEKPPGISGPTFTSPTAAWLGPLPMQTKLRRSMLLITGAAVAAAALVSFLTDTVRGLLETKELLKSTSKVLAAQAGKLGVTTEPAQVAALIETQMLNDRLTGAAIYLPDGKNVAQFSSPSSAPLPSNLPAPAAPGMNFGLGTVSHFEPISHEGKTVGTLLLRSNFGIIVSAAEIAIITSAIAMVVGIVVALRQSRKYHPVIAEPLATLADTAREVVKDRDFSKRAVKCFDDETGAIAESLNDVCKEVEKRDAELESTRKELEAELLKARAELESNVLARTSELHEQIEDRKRTEEAMKESEARYRNLFENNPMPMFVMHLETLKFVAVNYAAVKHYGFPMEEFLSFSLGSITHGADLMTVMRTFRSNAKSFDAGEWKHTKKNGEIIDVQLTAHAIIFGGQVAKIVLANDVTERNRAQRELEDLHKKLVTASRQAGQAEVATGVLHNVGNVLNSVNVSASVLESSVKSTKATGIRKVAELLQAHSGDLPAFFGESGKGRMLPHYLSKLADQIAAEQAERLDEISQLTSNIAHIKDIVASQQSYAKVSGLIEIRPPRTLIDEALRMTLNDMESVGVTTIVECPETIPDIQADPHKVLQILVNLLTNARHAVTEMPPEQRRIMIRVTHDGGPRVAVTVEDTGCGIPEENLTRIFNHGFTTKPNGHGFGLHTAANAAKEMNSTLTAASDGPGSGATFVLEVPVHEPVSDQNDKQQAA